ncbi:MAG: galactokinase, partial [Acidobacteriota bacterium]
AHLAQGHPACWGARMTGAGFGGSAVALVKTAQSEAFRQEIQEAYRRETGLPGTVYLCRPVGGARLI